MTEQETTVLFNVDFLREKARELATAHKFTDGRKPLRPVKPMLDRAQKKLIKAYRVLAQSAKSNQDISSAGEWLIDNFYIIQEQIVQIQHDFPEAYQKKIPKLLTGSHKGFPRVYELVYHLASYTDSVIDEQNITLFTTNYQESETLQLGELWAIPIMIRLVLIQQLADRAAQILERRDTKYKAQKLIDQALEKDHREPGWLTRYLNQWVNARERGKKNRLLLISLITQLQARGLLTDVEKKWFDYQLNRYNTTLERSLRDEAQYQSRLHVGVQNAIISLRNTSEIDWSEFIETCSVVDQILRLDPAGVYENMDLKTKDLYRRTIEKISRASRKSETEIARKVLTLSESAASANGIKTNTLSDAKFARKHVGYYLIGGGYRGLRADVHAHLTYMEWLKGVLEKHPTIYISFIVTHTLILMGIMWLVVGGLIHDIYTTIAIWLVALFPALDLSVVAINRAFTLIVPPRILPKMDFKDGITDAERTLVVVPTLLHSEQDATKQIEDLEVKALANPDPRLQFALLSDFPDSTESESDTDAAILKTAKTIIRHLNKKYRSQYGDKFFLLHRDLKWNPSEKAWMGWERKRGKLEQLNEILLSPDHTVPFTQIEGEFVKSIRICQVRYIITLDADTRLPPTSAVDLIRTAAHPLNRAYYDENKRRITRGYGIFQPRISIPPDAAEKTYFSRIFSGNVGIDPYTTSISDIYQDIFGEGIYTGKGLYDVQAFHTVLGKRLPENRILSHDLLESNYLRAALLTDIELFDDYPTTFATYSKRNHRWIRGDWQLVAWLFPHIREKGVNVKNPLTMLSRWKIFDNLRRSLNPLFMAVLFLAGWFFLPGSALVWTMAAFGILAFPIYVSFSADVFNRPARVTWKLYMEKIRSNLTVNTAQVVSTLAIIPHQIYVNLDAILRTCWRLFISKKHLLEWTTASQVEKSTQSSFMSYLGYMTVSILFGASVILLAFEYNMNELWLVGPFGLLWIISPGYAWYISNHPQVYRSGITDDQRNLLHKYARRTWFYFETLVNEDESWLPPDNYQEDPTLPPVARTSPTNIGLSLVATQVAYDMGYITLEQLFGRLDHTLGSLQKLDRYRGHFYNWYDTRLGEVLNPKYISTVDSGNLAASLIVIREAVSGLVKRTWPNPQFIRGFRDTIEVVEDILNQLAGDIKSPVNPFKEATDSIDRLKNDLDTVKIQSMREWLTLIARFEEESAHIADIDLTILKNTLRDEEFEIVQRWIDRPFKQVQALKTEFMAFFGVVLNDIPEDLPAYIRLDKTSQYPSITTRNEFLFKLSCIQNKVNELSEITDRLVSEMDFKFLYIRNRGLLSIGFNTDHAEQDKSTYDLLASEARIASFIAIAKGDIPAEHWFRLARRLTSLDRNEILLSWGGTMFEYLMPLLYMRSYNYTLLHHTYDKVIQWQEDYGNSRNRPWGFSESAYNLLNMDLHYQYRAFGAPGLGLKRGLAEEYVVAPYATMLALMINPEEALVNLGELVKLGCLGTVGFYDSVDFTPTRLIENEPYKVVKTYMAHHHGMSLLAIANVLNGWEINNYFHANPMIKSCELLLQEKIPRGFPIKEPQPIDVELEPGEQHSIHYVVEHMGLDDLDSSPPRVHLLSNGRYATFVSHAGSGLSRYKDYAMTRWQADGTTDPMGFFFYVKDLDTDEYWSATHQPVRRKPDRYDTWYHSGKTQTSRVDEWIETTTEICVSPEHNMELRKITLTNYSDHKRRLQLTSYAEVVLNRPADDAAHPAFSKLFIQTEYLAQHHALLAKRRPRNENEKPVWLVHTVASYDLENLNQPLQFETDRTRFIGRGRSLSKPLALEPGNELSGTTGNVTDPIVSLRRTVELNPGEKMQITFGLGRASSREEAVWLADFYDNPYATERVFDLASIYALVEMEHANITVEQAHYFQKMASFLLYSHPALRGHPTILKKNTRQQSALWPYGISGDYPLVVCRIEEGDQLKTAEALLKAHAFWRTKGLVTELLILNDHPPSYADEVQDSIIQSIQVSIGRQYYNKKGGLFVQRTDKIPEEDLLLIFSVASVVIKGFLPDLVFEPASLNIASFYKSMDVVPYKPLEPKAENEKGVEFLNDKLTFFNGYGGFGTEGDEYHIELKPDDADGALKLPPAPWINVVANPVFGFMASERGPGSTWNLNSRENKLTGWSNDPVTDPPSEIIYLRDEVRHRFWSTIPLNERGIPYRCIHGLGYTTYHSIADEIEQVQTHFVDVADPVKITLLSVTNKSRKQRQISVFHYHDWVLGVNRNNSSRFVIPEIDATGKIIYAVNSYNNEFAGKTAFASVSMPDDTGTVSATTNRQTFIGRNRSLDQPAALVFETGLDNSTKIGGDPCAAFQITMDLQPGEKKEIIFLMGESADKKTADALIQQFGNPQHAADSFGRVKKFWKDRLALVRVNTPEPSVNLLMNNWLMYQTVSCRVWARSAFYQSGGALGFRDQLQDAMALVYFDPQLARNQILEHAARQFPEGDVQHWWHPPTGRGIRTRISDDLLWLPYVTDFYIRYTGDRSILDESIPYIKARTLEENEYEAYLQPRVSSETGTLYDHCCRAIDHSLKFGSHGLPLIGTGDWNDGMNRIGHEGKGESVWLGFFLYNVLNAFQSYSKARKDQPHADNFQDKALELKQKLNQNGWDGNWYLRAFYDDGSPLGSANNTECQIDAISQAWSVISGASTENRMINALRAVEERLVSNRDALIRLLAPPFDRTDKNPGYIMGYIPGVRENGGQYTHAAIWIIKAFAETEQGSKAVSLLDMINPLNHTRTMEDVMRYKVEPYVVAADVYGELPLTGQGGWTWYTGSAGWFYRVVLESILGIGIENRKTMKIHPRISGRWPEFTVTISLPDSDTRYTIRVENPNHLETGQLRGTLDNMEVVTNNNGEAIIEMENDNKRHFANLTMERRSVKNQKELESG